MRNNQQLRSTQENGLNPPEWLANRVDRLRALGNGQVPAVAALAWSVLLGRLQSSR